MNWFQVWMRSSGPAALGTTLIHSLWEGAAIALALAVALCFLRSARARYGAACAAMICLVVMPVATFTRLTNVDKKQAPRPGRIANVSVAPDVARGAVSQTQDSPKPGSPNNLSWLTPLWLGGMLLFQCRALAGWMTARRFRRTGLCCAPAKWCEDILRLSARMRLSRPVTLLESCLAETPLVIGYLRPVILMPVGLLMGMPTTQVEAILLHEMAHLRRHDYLVNLAQTFVEGLLFYHPAVWWISGVMRAERENCCDDLVVAVTGGAYEYASALAALEQNRARPREALAATGGSLKRRIGRLLGRGDIGSAAMAPVFAGVALICTVTAAIALQSRPISPTVQHATQEAGISAALPVTSLAEQSASKSLSPRPARLLAQAAQIDPQLPRPNQQAAEPQQDVARPLTEEQQKARAAALRRELETPYKKWLDQDVVYIISEEEKKAFQQLNTDDERGQFVEQFWLRRDPTPQTSENEFKEEVYRRISYANEHFTASVPGWRTDRGRIYIQFGPPDENESHPSGGSYQRPADQGNGTIETFPFEQWRYRFIEGIGANIIIEFVDKTASGDYRMTMDPTEKDILMHRATGLFEKNTRPSQ